MMKHRIYFVAATLALQTLALSAATPESVVSKSSAASIEARVSMLRKLESPMDGRTRHVFLGFLQSGQCPNSLTAEDFHYLQNEIMHRFAYEQPVELAFVELLSAIVKDARRDLVTRDYALQFCATVYERTDAHREAIAETYRSVLVQETYPELFAAALTNLSVLQQKGLAPLSQEELDRVRLRVSRSMRDSHAPLVERISAIQSSAWMLGEPSTAYLLELLEDPSQPVMLRVAGMGALASREHHSLAERLESLLQQDKLDPRVRKAAELNLARLRN